MSHWEPDDDEQGERFVRVPHDQLKAETLRAVIESFIHRNGTDYGEREASLDTMVAQLMGQLEDGSISIVFNERDESVTLVPTRELRGLT